MVKQEKIEKGEIKERLRSFAYKKPDLVYYHFWNKVGKFDLAFLFPTTLVVGLLAKELMLVPWAVWCFIRLLFPHAYYVPEDNRIFIEKSFLRDREGTIWHEIGHALSSQFYDNCRWDKYEKQKFFLTGGLKGTIPEEERFAMRVRKEMEEENWKSHIKIRGDSK